MDNNMNKKKLLKTALPLLIIAIIIGIWFAKNLPSQAEDTADANLQYPLNVSAVNLDELKAYNMPIIIDFGADSCIPCKEMAPVLKLLNAELQGKAIIQFVDVWKNPDGAKDFPVQVIPTQIFYTKDGKPYVPSDGHNVEFTMFRDRETNEHLFTVHKGGLTEAQMRAILKDMGV